MENYRMTYTVDLVFCIDCTNSMGPCIDMVKESAIRFYDDLVQALQDARKHIEGIRVKIVAFRDYLADSEPMQVTDFFVLPQQKKEFTDTVRGIVEFGGGDEPEDGLEALAYAIRSDWSKEGTKKRQIIVVWSDASTHPLGFGKASPNYPANMARNFSELTEWWGDAQREPYMQYRAKRLILFTPENSGWKQISDNWGGVVHYPSVAGEGLKEHGYQEILSAIVKSV